MSEFISPEEANSPESVIQQEVQRHVEGSTVGDIRFTVFHDHCSIYLAQRLIYEQEDQAESAHGREKMDSESELRVQENRQAIALERQADRSATVPGYYREYALLSAQFDRWINAYENLAGVDFGEAFEAVNEIMRLAKQKILEQSATSPSDEASMP